MSGLVQTMAAIPGGYFRLAYGTAHWDGSEWFANIGGNLLACRWLDPLQLAQGGNIVVAIIKDEYGQSSALVLGGYTDQPRPSSGAILTLTPEVIVTPEFGPNITVDRVIGTYVLGDPVYLSWDAARATIIGKIPTVGVLYEGTPPTTASSQSGSTTLVPTASDTFAVGGWGRWASSQQGGEDVYSGTQSGFTTTGSWFYGAPKPELAGKTVTRIRFNVPPRLNVGAHNSAATIHIYAHNSGSRPGGDVTRVVGPEDVGVAAKSGGGFVDLPLTFAAALVGGGGISIAGEPYVGFMSRLDNPEYGKLILDWSS